MNPIVRLKYLYRDILLQYTIACIIYYRAIGYSMGPNLNPRYNTLRSIQWTQIKKNRSSIGRANSPVFILDQGIWVLGGPIFASFMRMHICVPRVLDPILSLFFINPKLRTIGSTVGSGRQAGSTFPINGGKRTRNSATSAMHLTYAYTIRLPSLTPPPLLPHSSRNFHFPHLSNQTKQSCLFLSSPPPYKTHRRPTLSPLTHLKTHLHLLSLSLSLVFSFFFLLFPSFSSFFNSRASRSDIRAEFSLKYDGPRSSELPSRPSGTVLFNQRTGS